MSKLAARREMSLSPWSKSAESSQQRISAIAQEICSRLVQGIRALPRDQGANIARGILRTKLAAFGESLKEFGDTLDSNVAKRTFKALDVLEELCQWPNPYYPVDVEDSNFSLARYPSLINLLIDSGCVREPLKKFFDDYKLKNKEAMKFLSRQSIFLNIAAIQDVASTLRGPSLSKLWGRRNTIDKCQDKEWFIVSLHNCLVKHCRCHCEQACDYMAANIRLNYDDNSPCRNVNASKFNLFFQDLHNTPDPESLCYWRDIEISVCTSATTRFAFKENSDNEESEEFDDIFEGIDVNEPSESTNASSKLWEELRICQFITEARQNQLQVKLVVSKGELKFKREDIPSRRFLTNVPNTSLTDLLHYSKLTDNNKAILSYFLVDSVWQYYDCRWEDWSIKSVRFMSERVGLSDSSEVVFVNQPFLYARFDKQKIIEANNGIILGDMGGVRKGGLRKPQPGAKVTNYPGKSHKYPKILALGIMLLEIQLGCKLESFKTSDYFDEDPNVVQHLLASDLLKDKKLWPPENAYQFIVEIIEICIDEKKAKAMLEKDSLMIRQNVYEQIVAPFRVFILQAWRGKGTENVDPITIKKVNCSEKDVIPVTKSLSCLNTNERSLTLPPLRMMARRSSEQREVSEPWLGGAVSAQLLDSSKKWFQDLGVLTDKLSVIETRDKRKCPQVKIAILDTGITEEYYDEFSEYIEKYKDFVSKNDEIRQDGTGHGSTTLRLLLKVNDDVKVFVGRVFERDDADHQTERVMAEAITYAKTNWKVDIICIPSGFNANPPDDDSREQLFRAVTAVSNPKAIIFAAASNLGLKSKITYPGCLSKSSKVLCLFSTDGDGAPSRFNPAAEPYAQSFALLGEGIKISPMDLPIKGTSFSTIITGAIGACIMDFVNHPDTKDKILEVWSLREVEGMASVFESMVAVRKEGYDILEPLKLLEQYQNRELSIAELRQVICATISKALRKRDSRR